MDQIDKNHKKFILYNNTHLNSIGGNSILIDILLGVFINKLIEINNLKDLIHIHLQNPWISLLLIILQFKIGILRQLLKPTLTTI